MKLRNSVLTLYIVLGLFVSTFKPCNSQTLSPSASISLLTCSPGEQLHTLFGHSAIRVQDTINKWDWVFNYGTFDFNTPNFYVKFARGKLNYMLSATHFNNFKRVYMHEKRSIYEQKLNLDPVSKQKLFNALLANYRPENRFYKYDFLFDNCSSRIRDIIKENVTEEIVFKDPDINTTKTFWNLLDPYMQDSRWIYLGIHLALGKPCDTMATPYQYMFLPDHLMEAFSISLINSPSNNRPLAQKASVIYQAPELNNPTPWYARPLTLFSLISFSIVGLSFYMSRKKKQLFWPDTLLFSITGLLGWVIFFLWFFTDHLATGPNLNILWAFPLNMPIAFLLLRKKRAQWIRVYFMIQGIVLLGITAGWSLIPQSMPAAVLPLIAAMAIRCMHIFKYYKVKS